MFHKLLKILILLVITTPALSQQKIVYLDIDFLFSNSIKGKNIQNELKNIDLKNIKILKEKEKELKSEENRILSQKNILSDKIYNEKVNDFKKKLDNFRAEKDKLIQVFDKTRKTKLDKFILEVNDIVEEYVENKSIDLVLNKKHILMGKNNYNITNEIMEILNTQN